LHRYIELPEPQSTVYRFFPTYSFAYSSHVSISFFFVPGS
jgi:hypothetical protein